MSAYHTSLLDVTLRRLCALSSVVSLASVLSAGDALARPTAVSPLQAISPHPKHCLDERQWREPLSAHPLNLFDPQKGAVWSPCRYATSSAGYSVRFPLSAPVQIDGFNLSQALQDLSVKPPQARAPITRLQVLFFNNKLSKTYPIYFHEVDFKNGPKASVTYSENLDWSPVLLRDAGFDERRRALRLPAGELPVPFEVDEVGVVFWSLGEGEAPPALELLSLTLKGKPLPVDLKGLRASRDEQAKAFAGIYPQILEGALLIGQERALVFAESGTLWGMEGEEETPKVMGRWRTHEHRVEVALGHLKSLKRAERRKRLRFEPLHSIIDEAPERVWLKHPRLQGEYQVSAMKPHAPPANLLGEGSANSGVTQGEPVKIKRAQPQGERPPTFEPLN